jgi:hypothetical protein
MQDFRPNRLWEARTKPLWGTHSTQPAGPRFQQVGDGGGGASPPPGKSGTEVPSPSPDKSGTGTGTGVGGSAPWAQEPSQEGDVSPLVDWIGPCWRVVTFVVTGLVS